MTTFDAEYFDSNYADYEKQNPTRKLRHYHQVIRSRTAERSVRALDIGCGLGTWAGYLADAEPGWSIVGMDVDPDIVAGNSERFPRVTFQPGRAGEGQPTEPFDLLTAMDVLEHVPDIENQFGAICNWLGHGGLFAFVVPVYDGPLGPVVHMLDKDPTHIHKWGRANWVELAGRHLDDLRWHGVFRLMLPWGHYFHLPSRRLRSVAPAIMVTGRVSDRRTTPGK